MIILSLLTDEDQEKRERGVALIQKARDQIPTNGIRYFNKKFKIKKAMLVFEAQSYDQMIDLDNLEEYTEPPCVMHIDMDELKKIASGEKKLDIGHILCHSTHCERGVALTTKASEKCIGYKARHGYMLSKQHSKKSLLGTNYTKTELLNFKHDFEPCSSSMDTS